MSADVSDVETDRLARLSLAGIVEPGDERMCAVVAELGAEAVRLRLLQDGADLAGRRAAHAERLAAARPERDLELGARLGLRFVTPLDDEWPGRLADLAHAPALQERAGIPLGLWVKGPMRLDELSAAVAIVGSRSATTYGTGIAADFGATLAGSGSPVISGGAYGIDQAAHRGALAGGGRTAVVLACGVDRVYPAAHERLIEHIGETGCVVSETPLGGAPTRGRFLSRNRLIAALSRATVVVEAAIRSGALNTANWADRLNRPVLGVPGPVTSAASQGVHQLVRVGMATLVTTAAEVLEVVGAPGEHLLEPPTAPVRPRDRLSTRDAHVLDSVPLRRPASADSIARTAGLGLLEVRAALARLAASGLVLQGPAGWHVSEPGCRKVG